MAWKISLEGTIQGDKPEERITRLQATMKDLPEEMKPVMETILGHWYWQFFQMNRWRFMERTATDQPPGEDINSWDLKRILAEIDVHFTAALAQEDMLRNIPVECVRRAVDQGQHARRGTAHVVRLAGARSPEFLYRCRTSGHTSPECLRVTGRQSRVRYDRGVRGVEHRVTRYDSPTIKALRLFQKLESFHQQDADPTARAEAELDRLVFANSAAVGEIKSDRYKAALQRFVQQYESQPISARARELWGQVLRGERQLVEARQVALPGWKKFPESPGGQLCYNLIQQIEAKEIQVATERVWNNPWPSIQVHYRNVTKVHSAGDSL